MQKILVLSDSHGRVEPMLKVIQIEKPDHIIHLGDCIRDTEKILAQFPTIPLDRVPGNCDFSTEPSEKMLEIEDKKVFITHGHNYGVKSSYLTIGYAAKERGADALLFGHTHEPYWDYHNHIAWLNPGSIGAPRMGRNPSYGLLIVENGEIFVQTQEYRNTGKFM